LIDKFASRQSWAGNELLDDAGGNKRYAVVSAAVVAGSELVWVGLQMLWANRSGMRAEKPPVQQLDDPVAVLQGVLPAPFCPWFGLHDRVMRPLVEAVAGVGRRL
jgi:hypothetical protein